MTIYREISTDHPDVVEALCQCGGRVEGVSMLVLADMIRYNLTVVGMST